MLIKYAPDSEEQQAAIVPIQDLDAFNWGYAGPQHSYKLNFQLNIKQIHDLCASAVELH